MSLRTVGIILVIVGIVVGAVAVLADTLGLGASPGTFGTNQIIGLVVGLVLVVIGIVVYYRSGQGAAA